MGKKRPGVSNELRQAIYHRDGYRCYRCGCAVKPGRKRQRGGLAMATLDHLIPRSKGGPNLASNLKTCCQPCNERRGCKYPHDLAAVRKRVEEEFDQNPGEHFVAAGVYYSRRVTDEKTKTARTSPERSCP